MAPVLLESVDWQRPAAEPPSFDASSADTASDWPRPFERSPTTLVPPTYSENIDERLSLVVLDRQGTRISSLELAFTRRDRVPGDVRLFGADPSGSLQTQIVIRSAEDRLEFGFHFEAADGVEAADLLRVIDWVRSLEAGERLELWSSSEHTALAAATTQALDGLRFPTGYRDTIELLTRVQQQTGLSVPVPDALDGRDIRSTERMVALLSGQTVEDTWNAATVIVDDPTKRFFDHPGPGGFRLDIADQEAGLGWLRPGFRLPVLRTFVQARVTSVAAVGDQWSVHLEPGEHPDATTKRLQLQDIEMCAGNWIADNGGLIVAMADRPDQVSQQLRLTNQQGAIWRVPATRQEAESVWA